MPETVTIPSTRRRRTAKRPVIFTENVSTVLTREQRAELDDVAAERGWSPGAVARECIALGLPMLRTGNGNGSGHSNGHSRTEVETEIAS